MEQKKFIHIGTLGTAQDAILAREMRLAYLAFGQAVQKLN